MGVWSIYTKSNQKWMLNCESINGNIEPRKNVATSVKNKCDWKPKFDAKGKKCDSDEWHYVCPTPKKEKAWPSSANNSFATSTSKISRGCLNRKKSRCAINISAFAHVFKLSAMRLWPNPSNLSLRCFKLRYWLLKLMARWITLRWTGGIPFSPRLSDNNEKLASSADIIAIPPSLLIELAKRDNNLRETALCKEWATATQPEFNKHIIILFAYGTALIRFYVTYQKLIQNNNWNECGNNTQLEKYN